MEQNKRKFTISAKVNKNELEEIKSLARAKGITVSELTRRAVLSLPLPKVSVEKLAKREKVFRKYLTEINRIGSNVNQVARYCNKHREVDVIALSKLFEIERDLEELLTLLYKELSSDS